MKGRMMLKWNWRKSRIILPRENEHLVVNVVNVETGIVLFIRIKKRVQA